MKGGGEFELEQLETARLVVLLKLLLCGRISIPTIVTEWPTYCKKRGGLVLPFVGLVKYSHTNLKTASITFPSSLLFARVSAILKSTTLPRKPRKLKRWTNSTHPVQVFEFRIELE